MTMRELTVWIDWTIGVTFWLCVFWPLFILTFWKWYESEWGWNLAVKIFALALALLGPVLHDEFGFQEGTTLLTITAVALTIIPIVILWRTWIILKTQYSGTSRSKKIHEPDALDKT
jgi:hypothetical protein